MNTYIDKLTNLSAEKNDMLSYLQARTWVELLWGDFEATYAKAGRPYQGEQMTERVVKEWIESYGKEAPYVPERSGRRFSLFGSKQGSPALT